MRNKLSGDEHELQPNARASAPTSGVDTGAGNRGSNQPDHEAQRVRLRPLETVTGVASDKGARWRSRCTRWMLTICRSVSSGHYRARSGRRVLHVASHLLDACRPSAAAHAQTRTLGGPAVDPPDPTTIGQGRLVESVILSTRKPRSPPIVRGNLIQVFANRIGQPPRRTGYYVQRSKWTRRSRCPMKDFRDQ